MATAQGIIEKVALEILALLDDEPKGLRFKEFKSRLKASEPVIARRLSMLKKYRLVTVMPVMEAETEKQYFAYTITDVGKGFINASLTQLLTKAREIENTSRKRSR